MKKTVAEWLVEQLAAWGVKSVYGVAGDALLPFIDAVEKHPGVNFYGVKHEMSAALMASAEAKLAGGIGVCAATGGPGAANMVNGLADAKNDQAPVLAITGQVESFNLDTGAKQFVDQGLLFRAVTDFSGLVTNPASCNDVVISAMRIAVARGTTAHVSFTKDVWQKETEEEIRPPEPYLNIFPQSSPDVIERAAKILNEAERPVILAGRGIRGTGGLVLEIAEKWDSGICLTMPAKGALPDDHPLVMGGLGEGGSGASTTMLARSDLVLIIGATWWPEKYVPRSFRIVQMDAVPENIGRKTAVDYGVVGELSKLLPAIKEKIQPRERWFWRETLHSLKKDWLSSLSGEYEGDNGAVHPVQLMQALGKTVDEHAVISIDVGDHTLWFNRFFPGKHQDILVSGTWRTMGFGLPAAISAKLREPDRQVIALVGDGGLSQTLAEFLTAVRYRVPVVVVVVNNGFLAMEKNRMMIQGMDYGAASLTNPDFGRFAELCGGKGFKVESPDRLEETLKEALGQSVPVIVDVNTSAPVFPGIID